MLCGPARTCVASTWPPREPSDAWRPPPSVPLAEQEEVEAGQESEESEELASGWELGGRQEAEEVEGAETRG